MGESIFNGGSVAHGRVEGSEEDGGGGSSVMQMLTPTLKNGNDEDRMSQW